MKRKVSFENAGQCNKVQQTCCIIPFLHSTTVLETMKGKRLKYANLMFESDTFSWCCWATTEEAVLRKMRQKII
jgi:hypothetical protein